METTDRRLREAIARFDATGAFGEEDYAALRAALSRLARSADADLVDGLISLFFERHLLDDRRRRELLALDDAALLRAVRHRFRQVVADEREGHGAWHALRPHVRDALAVVSQDAAARAQGAAAAAAAYPVQLREAGHFDRWQVQDAVRALCAEWRRVPTAAEATSELLRRYQGADVPAVSEAHDAPEAIRRRLDGQRLAAGILELLTDEERSLLRHVLDEGSVEDWSAQHGCSRATAYRMMARLKTLCRLEFAQRSNGTQVEALEALRGRL